MNTSQKLSDEELYNLVEENIYDWEALFRIMKDNDLEFYHGDIRRTNGTTIYILDESEAEYYFIDLLITFYNYWTRHEKL